MAEGPCKSGPDQVQGFCPVMSDDDLRLQIRRSLDEVEAREKARGEELRVQAQAQPSNTIGLLLKKYFSTSALTQAERRVLPVWDYTVLDLSPKFLGFRCASFT